MCLIVQFLFYISWEQCELGKIANEVTRTDPESTAPIMMITANNGFIEQSDRYAFDNAGESLKKYILLEKGELAYNHGASKLRPYGSCFALTTVEKARIPFVYHCFSAKNYNSEFLSIELNGENVEKQLRRIVSSGARMDGLLNISFTEYSTITLGQDEIGIVPCFKRPFLYWYGGFKNSDVISFVQLDEEEFTKEEIAEIVKAAQWFELYKLELQGDSL